MSSRGKEDTAEQRRVMAGGPKIAQESGHVFRVIIAYAISGGLFDG